MTTVQTDTLSNTTLRRTLGLPSAIFFGLLWLVFATNGFKRRVPTTDMQESWL